jgi:hypothetical protein
MKNLLAALFMSLFVAAPLAAEEIDDHPGLKLVVAQLKLHQRFTPEFVEMIRPHAEKGDKGATFALALTYIFDKGIARDEAESIRWVEKAWRAGDMQDDVQKRRTLSKGRSEIIPLGQSSQGDGASRCPLFRWIRQREGPWRSGRHP